MRPILFYLFGRPIWSYRYFWGLGIWLGMAQAGRGVRSERVEIRTFAVGVLLVILTAIIGAHAAYIWTHPATLDGTFGGPLEFWKGGYTFYGGLALSLPVALAYAHLFGLPIGAMADLAAPSVALCQAYGRVGCLLHGCCYGRPTDSRLGVHLGTLAGGDLARYPTQAYESLGLLAIFLALTWIKAHRRRRPGQLLGWLLIGYGVLRFGIEMLRDPRVQGGPWVFGILAYQWYSLIAVAVGVAIVRLARDGPADAPPEGSGGLP